MSLEDDLYRELIIEHSQHPSHRHTIENPTIVEEGVNRSCGDVVVLQLLMDQGVIRDIALQGQSCSICTASGSLMADALEGRTTEQAEDLIDQFKTMVVEGRAVVFPPGQEDLGALAGVSRYPVRVKCATLPWNTLEQALKKR